MHMRKMFKKIVASVTAAVMVATLFVGMNWNGIKAEAADNLLTGEWEHTHKNYEVNDALIASTRVIENEEGGFTAKITMTGWQREWYGVDYMPDDVWAWQGGWCDNPYQLNSAITMAVTPKSTYNLKFDVANDMNTGSGNPSEKNITVTVSSTVEGDDSLFMFTTVRVDAGGTLSFDRKFTVPEDYAGDSVNIQIAYGAYAYSYEISASPFLNMMPQEIIDKYVYAPGTTEEVNLVGTLDFTHIEAVQVDYEEPTTKAETSTTDNSGNTSNTVIEACTCNHNVAVTTPTAKVTKPGKATVKKAKNIKGKKVKVTWKKVDGATKYQVRAVAGKNKVKKTTSKLKITLKKLKKNKTYKVSVRAYNSAGYGKWSKAKKVKITK